MEKTILVLAYYSFRDPVFQSAVLPYFVNFPVSNKFRFVLLTYEHSQYAMTAAEVKKTELYLQSQNIVWYRSQWRSGTWKPIKKVIDFLSTIYKASRLIRKYKVCAIYSEGFPGAILGYYTARLNSVKHLVHTFEPHTDYMVEAGVWKDTSWETTVMRWHEKRVALHCSYIFTATNSMINQLTSQGVSKSVLHRVPSCVDLDHFKFDDEARQQIRTQFGITEDQPVLVYLGKFGGMYMENEAFEFFKMCQQELNAYIFVLSTDEPTKLHHLAKKYSLAESSLLMKSLTRKEVPSYLSAGDMGFVAVRQWPSKKYCSPIKTGEYLACGLPVIVPQGVSDDYVDMQEAGIGIVMPSFKNKSFHLVINEWKMRFIQNNQTLRQQARSYAAQHRAINVYKSLYAQLFSTL
jgi:glycosyltransferase involved in cell wall biosynthesis